MNTNLIEWLLTGGVGIFAIKWAYKIWHSNLKHRRHFTKQLELRNAVYKIFDDVFQQTAIKRFVIIKTENGGGKPRLDSQLYLSVIFEDFLKPFTPLTNRFQRVICEKEYVELLRKVSIDGVINNMVEEMPDGITKYFLEDQGVAFNQMWYIYESKTAFYYCSVSTDADGMGDMTSFNSQLVIRMAVNRLAILFKKHTS